MGAEAWLNAGVGGLFGLLIGSFLNVVIYRLPKMMERQWAIEAASMGLGADSAQDGPTPRRHERLARHGGQRRLHGRIRLPDCRHHRPRIGMPTRGHGIVDGHDGIVQDNVLASYAHLRCVGGEDWARRFVAFIEANAGLPRRAGAAPW